MTNRDAIRTLRVIQTDLHLQGYDEAYISALAHAIKLMDMADDACPSGNCRMRWDCCECMTGVSP